MVAGRIDHEPERREQKGKTERDARENCVQGKPGGIRRPPVWGVGYLPATREATERGCLNTEQASCHSVKLPFTDDFRHRQDVCRVAVTGPPSSLVAVSCSRERRRLLSAQPSGTARRQPTPGEPIWSLRHEHVTWSAELRFHGESYASCPLSSPSHVHAAINSLSTYILEAFPRVLPCLDFLRAGQDDPAILELDRVC